MSHLSPIPPPSDLSDLLIAIELRLTTLKWLTTWRDGDYRHVVIQEPRLIQWAIVACERSIPAENITALLEKTPSERHWWLLRSLLPEMALRALDARLTHLIDEVTRYGEKDSHGY